MSMLVNPYRFGAGAAGDVTIAVQDFVTGTSTGSQSFTSTTITGLTPKAALLVGAGHSVANDPGGTARAQVMIGSIGSGSRSMWSDSVSASANTDVQRLGSTTRAMTSISGVSTIKAATGSLVSGGVSLDFTTNGSASFRHLYVAFAGADCTSGDGIIALGTGTSAISVNCGFQPDVVILYGTLGAFNDTRTAVFGTSFGVATATAQRCVIWVEGNALASSSPFQLINTSAAGGQISNTDGSLTYQLVVGGFSSSGFTVTPSASAGSDDIAYLALKFTNRSVKLADLSTPTSTGSSAITGVGFEPQFALAVSTNLEAVNSYPGATSTLQNNLCIGLVGDEQWSATNIIHAGAATTSTASFVRAGVVDIIGSSGSGFASSITASLTSFDGDGMTLNYSAVQANAKKGFILFIE